MEIDLHVGRVLDTLRELGLEKKTLVIFTSDNGGPTAQGAKNTPLRGSKGHIQGIRILPGFRQELWPTGRIDRCEDRLRQDLGGELTFGCAGKLKTRSASPCSRSLGASAKRLHLRQRRNLHESGI